MNTVKKASLRIGLRIEYAVDLGTLRIENAVDLHGLRIEKNKGFRKKKEGRKGKTKTDELDYELNTR